MYTHSIPDFDRQTYMNGAIMEKTYFDVKSWMETNSDGVHPSEIQIKMNEHLKSFGLRQAFTVTNPKLPDWLIIWFDNGHHVLGMEYEFEPTTETYTLIGCWVNVLPGWFKPGESHHGVVSIGPSQKELNEAWKRAMQGV